MTPAVTRLPACTILCESLRPYDPATSAKGLVPAPPDALLQLETLPQQHKALMAQLLQLLLQPQVVLYLLLGVAVTQACCGGQLLRSGPGTGFSIGVSVSGNEYECLQVTRIIQAFTAHTNLKQMLID